MNLSGNYKNKPLWVSLDTGIPVCRELSSQEKLSGAFSHFDSKGEYALYRRILSVPGVDVVKGANLTILPSSGSLSPVKWNIDFRVKFQKQGAVEEYFVEYKGGYISSDHTAKELLSLKCRLFQRNADLKGKLRVVTEVACPVYKGFSTVTPAQLITEIIKEQTSCFG